MRLISGFQRVIACVGVFVLSACGGSDGGSVVSGRVLDANQAAVANAEVIAVDRLSGREFNAKSQADGSYRMVLPEGHYDLGADDAKLYSAHMVMLHTLRGSDTKVNFALPSDQPQAQLSGRVLVREGVPAANYRLVFSSNHGRNDDAKLDMETTTDAQGNFTVSLGVQRLLDVDIYDTNNNFVEFVVLHKLDGALRADITLGEAGDNKAHRHSEATDADKADAKSVATAAVVDGNRPFKIKIFDWAKSSKVYKFKRQKLMDGVLPVNGGYLTIDKMVPLEYVVKNTKVVATKPSTTENVEYELNSYVSEFHDIVCYTSDDCNYNKDSTYFKVLSVDPHVLNIFVNDKGKWWFDYAVNFSMHEKIKTRLTLSFLDEGGDKYEYNGEGGGIDSLFVEIVDGWSMHKVSYNSKKPNIIEVWTSRCWRYIDGDENTQALNVCLD